MAAPSKWGKTVMAEKSTMNLGKLELSWAQGYAGQEIFYLDSDTLCYQCGRSIQVCNSSSRTAVPFHGRGLGPMAAHATSKHLAIAERCISPKIFIYLYPSFAEHAVLEGGAKIQFQRIAFSASHYMLSLAGLPDFELVLWNFMTGTRLTSVALDSETPASIAFNPANWRQICVVMTTSITVWNIEQCNNKYILLPQRIKLPPEDEEVALGPEDPDTEMELSCSNRMSKYAITIPRTAIAGLIGEMADRLDEIQDQMQRVLPVSLAWTPTGDIYIGCKKGHLLRIDGESYKVKVLLYPVRPSNAFQEAVSSLSHMEMEGKEASKTSNKAEEEEEEVSVTKGSMDCLGLHRLGLFAVGEEGVLRLLSVVKDDVELLRKINVGVPVSSFTFAPSFLNIALGSPMGSIMTVHVEDLNTVSPFHQTQCGEFVSIGLLPVHTPIKACVTCRSNGVVQVWSNEHGHLLSSINIGEPATCMEVSPLVPVAVVGSAGGFVYFVNLTAVDQPIIVNRIHLYQGPIKKLMSDMTGSFIFSAGDDANIFVMSGLPSKRFDCLAFIEAGGEVRNLTLSTRKDLVRVLVGVHTGKHNKESIDRIVRFEIDKTVKEDIEAALASKRRMFKDEAVTKVTFFLLTPCLGIALGTGDHSYTVSHANRNVQMILFPAEIPKRKDSDDFFLGVEANYDGHQLPGAELFISPNTKWLVSFGADGYVMLRKLSAMEYTMKTLAHDHKTGGVSNAIVSDDSQHVFTTGYDGVLCCFKWIKEGKPEGGTHRGIHSDIRHAETHALAAMEKWEPPPPLSRSPSAIELEKENKRDAMKKAALENQEIYRTPTPEARANSTWLEEREFEVLREEEAEFAETKQILREQIRDIRKTIQEMMTNNEQLPEIEKLGRHEFDLDIDEQTRLNAEGEAEVERVKEEIEFDNLAKRYLRDMIKQECWDNMWVKGRAVQAFNSNLEVANFPLIERSKNTLARLAIVTARRKVEAREMEVRKKEFELVKSSVTAVTGDTEDVVEPDLEEDMKIEHPSITGSMGAQYGGANELFYNQFELYLRHQKINQIVLLEDAIYRIKVTFNREFDMVFAKKEQEILKIKEKNKRISKILDDLNLQEEVHEPQMSIFEKPEQLLTVEDHEVKVEKYLTPAQQKKMEEERKAEEERRLREKGDNQRERALEQMMGGVLEIRKEDELKKDIPIPLFMQQGKPENEWNEEEIRSFKEYERKCQELIEEREKFRKHLETELRKLQGVITENMAAFDETLNQLFMRKIKVMMVVYQEELKIQRIRYSLLQEEELDTREKELHFKLEHKKKLKALASEAVIESRSNLDDFRNEYDILVAEDKVMDKAFKREFNDVSNVMSDQLYRLFRKRPRGHKYKTSDVAMVDGRQPNPFAERPSTAKQNDNAKSAMESVLDEMDKVSHMPEGLDSAVWDRMCKYRRTKIESEHLVKQKALMLAEIQAFLQKRNDEDDALKYEIEEIQVQLSKLKEDQHRFMMDLEVQLLLKQGQVEVDSGQFVPDYTDSVLIHRSVVEDLNTTIKALGESKIASMVESKDFRKGIIQLEWEHKKMSMQMQDLQDKMKDIQFMKVSREIQAYLMEEDYELKKQNEIATLEKTILSQKQHHDKMVSEKRKAIVDLKGAMKHKDKQNAVLDEELRELNVAVNERRHIDCINATQRLDTGAERRYQEILQRRKLVDLAKAQAQEVAVLRAEVERLRMRTFPALIQVEQ